MKRFLFVVPPLTGHVNPTISVARALAARGHEVAWAAHPQRVRPLLPDGARLIPLDDGSSDEAWRPVVEHARSRRGLEAFEFLWQELLLPLARSMLPGVRSAIAGFAPDVIIVDHQAIAGALAARAAGAPWATFCTTSASVVDPLAALPRVKQWVADSLAALERDAGLPATAEPDLSPHLVVVFSTEALVGGERAWPARYRFVGPSTSDRPDATPFPWHALRPGPRLFVSLGTVSTDVDGPFYDTLVEALRDEPLQVIVAAPPQRLAAAPESFLVQARVPQLALLPRVDAVLTHGGHNTVCEALASGLPLVVTPIRDDQPVIADQVARAGAGLRLKFGRLRAPALREAVRRVLDEPSFRESAARLRASFDSAGGAPAAATALEELA
jgi:MGT family glycosyltransferase